MCGILFLFNKDIDVSSKLLSLQDHRGPDNTTIINVNGHSIGHQRLSIINTSEEANQPFEVGNYCLVANAEIYNWKSICPDAVSDCMAIIEVAREFDHYSSESAQRSFGKLDGDYAFILYNKMTGVILVGRDPVGLKPLYVGYKDNKIVGWASEAKSLGECERIESIEPGTLQFYTSNNFNNLTFKLQDKTRLPKKLINKLLTESVEKRVKHTDVPMALLCSGGIDSTIITAIASTRFPERQFTAFTIEYVGGGLAQDSYYAELAVEPLKNVKLVKFKFNFEDAIKVLPEVIRLYESCDIQVVRAGIPMYLLAKYIRENTDFKVLLSGEGADELFMGYNYFSLRKPTSEQASKESRRLVKNLHDYDILRAERSFSSNGLELRVPFLDRDLVEYVLDLDGSVRVPYKMIEKHLLRESFKDLPIHEKLLVRQKERLSDGVGGGWVPDLIRHHKNKEKEAYKEIYDQHYKNIIRVERVLPDWAVVKEKTSMLME